MDWRESHDWPAESRLNPQACVLGIDVGTTAVRIVAVCANAAIRGQGRANLEATRQTGRGIQQDPGTWWQATGAALLDIGQRIDLRQIRALCIDATSGTVVGVDRRGLPQTYGRMYNDRAQPAIIEALARILPENSAARGATSPLARMIEMQGPGIHKLLHQADWLTGQFSGRFDTSDENNALKSGFDLLARAWPAWIADTGIDAQLLPQVVPTGTDIGEIRSDVAAQFGFTPNVRIVAGTTDGCASFLASGACNLGDGVTSLGTTLTLKQICSQPIAVAKFGIYSHRLGDRWLCGGASNSGGAVLLQFFSAQQLTELEARLDPERDTKSNYYPLPAKGERFPHANPHHEPVMGPRPPDDAQFLQGLLEGIASIERTGYGRLQEFGAPAIKRVITVGGGSRNEAWRRIRERVMGVPIISGMADAAYGAALIALSALQQRPLFARAIQ
jgi:sugar (pentulose or hexulose) kinase